MMMKFWLASLFMINIYGLKNCDSCRKALKWLDKNNQLYNFFDFKNFALSESLLSKWIEAHSLEKILNKRSTTWRNLDKDLKNNFEKQYIKIIIKNTSLIKRPIWEFNNLSKRELLPGFDEVHQKFFMNIK
tara:strand:- start:4723 stop:5115 length:393 start_codon:yes stop_codon:yes gene_type:complete